MLSPFDLTVEQQSELQSTAVAKGREAEVKARYAMALHRPRNDNDCLISIQQTCRNKRFASKAKYAKPVGQSKIVGPSIRLAEELARQYKNILVQQTTIYEDLVKRIIMVSVSDLETNMGYTKEIPINKTVERKSHKGRDVVAERLNAYGERVFVVLATEDELQNKEAALASKAIRNGVLRVIPEHILDAALEVVDETMRAKVAEDPEAE